MRLPPPRPICSGAWCCGRRRPSTPASSPTPRRTSVHKQQAMAAVLAVYGSCAGMILLADRVVDAPADQETFGGIDMTVRRNAFGRQVDSFEEDIPIDGLAGGPVHAVFIRAPWAESVGPAATPLA